MASIGGLAFFLFGSSAVFAGPQPVPTPAPALAVRQAGSPLPLTQYNYAYSDVPEQVNPYSTGRGPQSGYNRCNSTTEGPNSECQTLIVNSIDDFCLWGSPVSDGLIGNVEAAVVAYCTKPGHGARVMPAGTLTGVQFVRTSAYIQVTGTLQQAGLNLDPTDGGGELDPHGADLMGNPLGGLVYSTSLGSTNGTLTQAINWSQFIGSNAFCIKLCFNEVTSPDYCQNIFDLIGCQYNMPANYTQGLFSYCQSDLQAEPGVYVTNGQTVTWSQPAELAPDITLPWKPSTPPVSQCTTYTSASLYQSQPTTTFSGFSAPTASGSGSKQTGSKQTGSASMASSSSSAGAKKNGSTPRAQAFVGGAIALAIIVSIVLA